MRRKLTPLAALIAALALAAPAAAITNGVSDDGEHPYVGELLFYVPDAIDSRFTDPGGWFTCSGTLLNDHTIVTAGHCTFGVGLNGESTTDGGTITTAAKGGTGGNDIWISFAEEPNFSILPPSSTFVPDGNQARYEAWSAALNASPEWHRGTAHPHPQYDDNAFFVHDAGIVVLNPGDTASMDEYGRAAGLDYLDQYASQPRNAHRFEVVGYGLEKVLPGRDFGGDTRMKAEPKLDNLSSGKDIYMILSNNTKTGGTCFGDSGGPTFDDTNSNLVVAVTSFGLSPNCTGIGGAYRLDGPDDQAFLASYGVAP